MAWSTAIGEEIEAEFRTGAEANWAEAEAFLLGREIDRRAKDVARSTRNKRLRRLADPDGYRAQAAALARRWAAARRSETWAAAPLRFCSCGVLLPGSQSGKPGPAPKWCSPRCKRRRGRRVRRYRAARGHAAL